MPTIYPNKTLTATSADILNAIRNSATNDYKNYIPVVTADAEIIRSVGSILMQNPSLMNEFLSALCNRIGKVLINSRLYNNPWAVFKKGVLEFGEVVEDIFVNIADVYEFDHDGGTDFAARKLPDVRASFYAMNYEVQYKVSVSPDMFKRAFLSESGIAELATYITNSLYTAHANDEFLIMKYLLGVHILDGHLKPVQVDVTAGSEKSVVKKFKEVSNKLTFLSPDYNIAGVHNFSDKGYQYLIINSAYDATYDVDVLASAFNMDKAEFAGHRKLVDSFGAMDVERLKKMIGSQPAYHEFSAAELTALDKIPAVIVDQNWFQMYDQTLRYTDFFNPQALYYNYYLTAFKVVAMSPFAPAAVFVPGAPSVTSVTVSPATATVAKGQHAQLSANVVTANFASKAVTWSMTGAAKPETQIDNSGNLFVASDETASTLTIKATSKVDPTKSGSATITIGAIG